MKGLAFIVLISTQISYIFTDDPSANGCFSWDSQCMTMYAQTVAPSIIQRISQDVVIDPLAVNLIEIHELGLVLDKTDVKMYGIKNLEVDHLSFNTEANMTRFVFHTDIYSTGHYKSSGSIFNNPLFGDSDYLISINNIEIEIILVYNLIKNAQGEDLAEILNHIFRFDIRDGATYFYENLYNGKKEDSDAIHLLWNKYWKIVSDVYGKKFVGGFVDGMVEAFSQYLKNTPISALGKLFFSRDCQQDNYNR